MFTSEEARELIDQIFEEEALALGGMVAIHEVGDDLVCRLVRNMDVIRGRVLERLDERSREEMGSKKGLTPHPAIEEFLLTLRRP
jgi:hypothetical protein